MQRFSLSWNMVFEMQTPFNTFYIKRSSCFFLAFFFNCGFVVLKSLTTHILTWYIYEWFYGTSAIYVTKFIHYLIPFRLEKGLFQFNVVYVCNTQAVEGVGEEVGEIWSNFWLWSLSYSLLFLCNYLDESSESREPLANRSTGQLIGQSNNGVLTVI